MQEGTCQAGGHRPHAAGLGGRSTLPLSQGLMNLRCRAWTVRGDELQPPGTLVLDVVVLDVIVVDVVVGAEMVETDSVVGVVESG